jgi:hypothetical protein
MVLHGGSILQEDESTPVEGSTITDKSAPWTTWRQNARSRMALANEATRKERILDASIAAFEIREVCSYIAIKLAS